MKLDFDTIKKITVGAVDIYQEDGFYHFEKCTKEQLALWKSFSDFLFSTASAQTGIRFDLNTNSTFVRVSGEDGGKIDVYVNGQLTNNLVFPVGAFSFEIKLQNNKENRVQIYLPAHSVAKISEIEIDDGCFVTPHAFKKKILFSGDSITQGYNSLHDSLSFANIVSNYFDAESIIQGIGGAFFDPNNAVKLDFNPDAVIVAYGTNDYNYFKSIEELEVNMRGFLSRMKEIYASSKLFYISPIWRTDEKEENHIGLFENFRNVLEKIAQDVGFNVIDGYTLMPHEEALMMDHVHPNEKGFSFYGKNLIDTLLKFEI